MKKGYKYKGNSALASLNCCKKAAWYWTSECPKHSPKIEVLIKKCLPKELKGHCTCGNKYKCGCGKAQWNNAIYKFIENLKKYGVEL